MEGAGSKDCRFHIAALVEGAGFKDCGFHIAALVEGEHAPRIVGSI